MTNILEAIFNITQHSTYVIRNHSSGRNRVNNIGDGLETFVKDAFSNTFQVETEMERLNRYAEEFSWFGNQNHPPDIMIKGGDAIEVKKIQNPTANLALNSSYPKSIVVSSSAMITESCRCCEEWAQKDLIYCVGHTDDRNLKSLWMVYGNIYAAEPQIYQIVKQKITKGIKEIPNVELAQTNELGRINRVDPLGITDLRIRGMWQIQNPRRVFNYIHQSSTSNFELVALIPKSKYEKFPLESKIKIEKTASPNLTIKNVQVKDPNNPARLIDTVLIVFKIPEI